MDAEEQLSVAVAAAGKTARELRSFGGHMLMQSIGVCGSLAHLYKSYSRVPISFVIVSSYFCTCGILSDLQIVVCAFLIRRRTGGGSSWIGIYLPLRVSYVST